MGINTSAHWTRHYRKLRLPCAQMCRDYLGPDYRTARPKCLFVLRETNDWPGGDLSDMLPDRPKGSTWHNVGRWSAGILGHFPPFASVDNQEAICNALSQIAAINLKKITGSANADGAIINAFAHQDRKLLQREIRELAPDIIIACGTVSPLIWLLDLDVSLRQQADALSKPIRYRNGWVIPFRHPSRANKRKTYQKIKRLYTGLKSA